MSRPPLHDIAHLSYVELFTPQPERSLWFFTEILGMTENGSKGDSVYLRTWDDYEQFTLKLTAHSTSGIGPTGLRAESDEALERRTKAIEASGLGLGWQDGEPGLGATYAFRDPDGHLMHVYYETDWYSAPASLAPALKNQASRYPVNGFSVRRLDHVNYLAQEVEPTGDFVRDILGGRVTEQIRLNTGEISAQWLHRRAADICLDAGVHIETGPHKHAIQQTFFLYVYEPGGNRIELCNPVARLVMAPDWKTITWTEAERAKGQAWGLKTIESFHTHGTPPAE
jgi:catechol 2,3-dioxygenase